MATPAPYPGELKRGAKGANVGVLQAFLQSLGYYQGGRIDNDFGPKTEEALHYFQMTRSASSGGSLKVTGVLDKATWEALVTARPTPAPVSGTDLFASGLNEERKAFLTSFQKDYRKNTREIPDGSNYGGEVSKYLEGIGPAYWCCFCVSWHYRQVTGRWPFGKRYGLCKALWDDAKKKGVAFDKGTRMPLPGDLFVLLYRNSKGGFTGTGHIGAVSSISPDGKKFNTFAGNEDNRLRFGFRNFSESTLVGFISLLPEEGCQPARKFLSATDVAALSTR